MTDCQNLSADLANAFVQVFDLGGWNAVLWVLIGWSFGGGPSAVFDWFENRRAS